MTGPGIRGGEGGRGALRRFPDFCTAGLVLALSLPGPGSAQEVPAAFTEAPEPGVALAGAHPERFRDPEGPFPEPFDAASRSFRQATPPISTRAAFIRGLLIPGWGHVATDSYFRGGVFVAAQTGAYWMVWKSVSRRQEARSLREAELAVARDRVRARGVLDPDSVAFLAQQDPALEPWDTLLERRGEQVEDWIFLSAFLALMGGVDAFVAAHLWDFPEALSLEVGPGPGPFDARSPSVEVRVSMSPEWAGRFLPRRRSR